MRFKTQLQVLLLALPLSYAGIVHAGADLPLDLIEFLGEMDDNDSMLEVALSDLEQERMNPQKNRNAQQPEKQNSPTGGDKQ